ncbi:ectonucleotide pyrophosphatase/phosphodiesterase family member 5-like [Glandiceps talaboti]
MMETVRSSFAIFSVFLSMLQISTSIHDGPLTLLISFDGFRWDYLQKTETPNFDQLIADGSFVPDGIQNSFITKTFPNHFTIATGMWEESHGIVANNMYDPNLKEHFAIGEDGFKDSKWWDNGAEPIWVTNQLHGGRSGVYFWPGSETKIKGILPYHYMNYSNTTPFKTRVDGIIDWFTAKEDPINLGLLYFNEPDHTGHSKGPDSDEIKTVIEMCDNITGYLIQRLKDVGLYDQMNLIITSDHGMAELDKSRVIKLDEYVNRDLYDYVDHTPVAALNPHDPKNTLTVYRAISNIAHMTVYMKGDEKNSIPDHFHYTNNPRIMPIIAMADEGWSIVRNMSDFEKFFKDEEKGGHGYDNTLRSMHPFFIASGPSIKKNFTSDPFKNVDIYPMICEIMNLKPGPNNGSLEIVSKMLNVSHSGHHHGYQHFKISERLIIAMIVAGTISLIAAILLTGMCWRQRKYRLTDYIPEPPTPDPESRKALLSAEEEA